jgi:hypothetical protein
MPKAAKIAIIVVGLAVGIGLIAWRLIGTDDGTGMANRVAVVDVLTGDAMWIKMGDGRLRMVPGKGEAGEYSLYPIEKIDGQWVIGERYRDGLLSEFSDDPRLKIDVSTFASPEQP